MLELSVVSSKGQISIPAFMREKYGIKAGDRIVWEDLENKLAIWKPLGFFHKVEVYTWELFPTMKKTC
jgi:AbrB family looped-hinge helix DNA binding protein